MTRQSYIDELNKFDWHFEFGSYEAWKRGQAKLSELRAMQSEVDPTGEIWMSIRPDAFGVPRPILKNIAPQPRA